MTTLRVPELKLGCIKEVDGNSISLRAEYLERDYEGTKLSAEVGAYVNCGGSHGDTICTITRVKIEEVEKTKKTDSGIEIISEERKVVTLSVIGCAVDNKFERGVKRLPTNSVLTLTYQV